MSNFTIEVQDAQIKAVLKRLHDVGHNMQPIMQDIGEGVMERAKQRFVTSTDPAGNKWLPLSQTTYEVIANRLGKSSIGKGGRVNSKGAAKLANKRILIESGDLSRQFHISADANSVTIGNSMVYAAIQQFGGQAGRNKKVTIPARPFLPVTLDGQLYPQERKTILDDLNQILADAIRG